MVGEAGKTKTQLVREVAALRKRVVKLELTGDPLQVELDKRKQAEAALQTRDRHYRALVEAMPDLMFRVSADGIFLDFVPSSELDPFMPPTEFLGKRIHEVLPREVATTCAANIKRALETGQPQVCEYRLERDGQVHDYEARIVVSGESEVLAIVRDISDLAQIPLLYLLPEPTPSDRPAPAYSASVAATFSSSSPVATGLRMDDWRGMSGCLVRPDGVGSGRR